MRQGTIRHFFASFLLVIHLFALVPLAVAGESAPEWTVEIAQQLLTDGWEDLLTDRGTTVVGYALHFVELKREAWALLSLGLEFDTKERGPGLWLLKEENFVFDLLFDSEFRFKPSLQTEKGHGKEKYDSWLLTMQGEPLAVNISSTRIPAPSLERKEEKLEVRILPAHVHHQTGQIESEISLVYETLGGGAVEVQTTARISAEPKRPIAVVSREIKTDIKTEYQYFALYLAGISIPAELLTAESPFVVVGSIAGMELFMEETPVRRSAEFEAGASFHAGKRGVVVNGSLPIGNNDKVYGLVQTLPHLVYVVGAEGGMGGDLYFVTELGGGEATATLFVGIRDELRLGGKTKVSATVLPVRFTPALPPQRMELNWRVRLEQDLNSCGLWYQVENVWEQEQIRHQAGLTALERKPIAARLSWSWDEQSGSTYTIGMRFKF